LEPDQSAIHIEHWHLFDDIDAGDTEADLDAAIMPHVDMT
jgi:hypothetical protein